MRTVAVTGATGFLGRHVAAMLQAQGCSVRVLVRREDAELARLGCSLWLGDLENAPALEALVDGATAVVHAAGVVRASDAATFAVVNARGSARVAALASRQTGCLFVQISSLAARVPAISPYAASKAQGEAEALRHAGDMQVVVVRPPALYGPGDPATLPLLRGLARGWLVHPRSLGARFSLLYVEDLVRLLGTLLADPPRTGTILEPDDGRAGGYGWADLAMVAQRRLGHRVRLVGVHRPPLAMAAWLAEWHGRSVAQPPILSRGKIAELYHRDWVSDTRGMAVVTGWRPRVDFGDGLTTTLNWYRDAGWL
ncbi:MAG: NAD-dependent epimerase/dehydratase family protein [Geminicoccaceae bacterium]